ncbi:MAG: Holliday junction resolvase RuvX [Betaproteobacteria bacterium]|nr:Holliday junction resolvase RuvX [Betaproteobacteria bacterium]
MGAAAETILGFDFGEKRIGVAVGNTITGEAQPLTTLHVESNQDRLAAVGKLVTEWQPARFVVGEPVHEDGRPHEVAHLAHKFGNRLKENFRLPVEYVNEFLSSAEAEQILAARGVRGIAQKEHIDAVAAQVILQNYLDEARRHAA